MTLIGAVASLFLKKASGAGGIVELIKNKNLYLGGILYVLSAVLNIYILRYLDYSVVLPLTSFTYIWTLFLSGTILNEKITKKKIFGVVLVIFGAVCIAR
ncbi:MAG: EamA family transporter [Lachnospiraceae bacterium]|nr:EamA family transporter [Lachnospiraceae bacterium]